MSQETAAAPVAPLAPLSSDPAEGMRQRVLALIENKRIEQRGFAENAITLALRELADQIKALPTR
jgi:hypothetical protein